MNELFKKSKKLKDVAPIPGKEAAKVNSPRICLNCKRDENKVAQLQTCAKCKLGLYCSTKCKKADSKNQEIFCKNIIELERIERDKTFHNFNISLFNTPPLLPKNRKKLTKLIGSRAIIKHQLNNRIFESLWDTGSMISLVNEEWVLKEFKNIEIRPIETFISNGADILLKAANNTDISVEGVVTLDFSLPNSKQKFLVPFIVTKEALSNPILGFNVIEHLLKYSNSTSDHTILENIFPSLNSAKIESVFNVITTKKNDFYGCAYNSTKRLLPQNSITYIKCKVNCSVIEMKSIPCIFELDVNLPETIVLSENLINFNPAKSKSIKIPLF